MARQVVPSRDELMELYVKRGMTAPQIAQLLGCGATSVRRWLHQYDIPLRARGRRPQAPPRELLERLYVQDGLNSSEIAQKLGYGPASVLRWLHAYEIPLRSRKKPITKEYLVEEYVVRQRRAIDIAAELDVSAVHVYRAMEAHGIPRRSAICRDRLKIITPEWVQDQRMAGRSIKDISQEIGCSPQSLYRRLRPLGERPAENS